MFFVVSFNVGHFSETSFYFHCNIRKFKQINKYVTFHIRSQLPFYLYLYPSNVRTIEARGLITDYRSNPCYMKHAISGYTCERVSCQSQQ